MNFENWIKGQSKKYKGNYDYWLDPSSVAKDAWNAALGLKDVNDLQYKIGDTLWFANGGDKLTQGKVVHIFGWGATVQYVLEYNAVIDYHVVCRNGLCVSENPEGPLNLSKLAKEAGIKIKKRLEERGIK